jgi:hypothetical protein
LPGLRPNSRSPTSPATSTAWSSMNGAQHRIGAHEIRRNGRKTDQNRPTTDNLSAQTVILHASLPHRSQSHRQNYSCCGCPASRQSRRAKTDKPDGEALVRTLLAYRRGELRVCAMVTVPSAEDKDRRRGCRERRSLVVERIRHVIPKRNESDSSRFGINHLSLWHRGRRKAPWRRSALSQRD